MQTRVKAITLAVVAVVVLLLAVLYARDNCHLGKWSKPGCSSGFCAVPPDGRAEAESAAIQRANGGPPTGGFGAASADAALLGRGEEKELFQQVQFRARARRSQSKAREHSAALRQNPEFISARNARMLSVRGVDQFAGSGTDHFGGPHGGGYGWHDPLEQPDRQQRMFDKANSRCVSQCTDGCNGSACEARCHARCNDTSRKMGLLSKVHSPEDFVFAA